MSLASLYNIPYDDITNWRWSFSNQDQHWRETEAIQRIFNINLQAYILDPIAVNDFGAWLYRHQAWHNQTNAVLGIIGNDLTGLDITDKSQLANWISLHGDEHRQAAELLKI